MMTTPIIVANVAEALAALPRLNYAPGDWGMSGPEEGDKVDLTVLVTDADGDEIFEIAESGNVETDKDLGRAIAEALTAAEALEHDFTFDLALVTSITVRAKNRVAAEDVLRAAFDCADTNFGAFPDGSPILGEVSLKGVPRLAMIDGE